MIFGKTTSISGRMSSSIGMMRRIMWRAPRAGISSIVTFSPAKRRKTTKKNSPKSYKTMETINPRKGRLQLSSR
jgi:hypothetical protein